EPLRVAPDLDPVRRHVEDLADLLDVRRREHVDLFLRELRTGRGTTRRVAEHRGEIADDQHRFVAAVLEQPEPAEHNGATEVDVGRGRVDAELDPQRGAALDLLAQLRFGDHVDRVRGQQAQLTVDVHGGDGNKGRLRTGRSP